MASLFNQRLNVRCTFPMIILMHWLIQNVYGSTNYSQYMTNSMMTAGFTPDSSLQESDSDFQAAYMDPIYMIERAYEAAQSIVSEKEEKPEEIQLVKEKEEKADKPQGNRMAHWKYGSMFSLLLSTVVLVVYLMGTTSEYDSFNVFDQFLPLMLSLTVDFLGFTILDCFVERFLSPYFTDSTLLAVLVFAISFLIRGRPEFLTFGGVELIKTIFKNMFAGPFVLAAIILTRFVEWMLRLQEAEQKKIKEAKIKEAKIKEAKKEEAKTDLQ